MTNTTTKKKGKRGRVVVALCDWMASLTPCERLVAGLYRLRYLYQSNNNSDDNSENDSNNNNNNNDTTTVITAKMKDKGSDRELLSQVGQTLTHLLSLLYTSTPAPGTCNGSNDPRTTSTNNFSETLPLSASGFADGTGQPINDQDKDKNKEQQLVPLIGNLRFLRSLHATDLLVEVGW